MQYSLQHEALLQPQQVVMQLQSAGMHTGGSGMHSAEGMAPAWARQYSSPEMQKLKPQRKASGSASGHAPTNETSTPAADAAQALSYSTSPHAHTGRESAPHPSITGAHVPATPEMPQLSSGKSQNSPSAQSVAVLHPVPVPDSEAPPLEPAVGKDVVGVVVPVVSGAAVLLPSSSGCPVAAPEDPPTGGSPSPPHAVRAKNARKRAAAAKLRVRNTTRELAQDAPKS